MYKIYPVPYKITGRDGNAYILSGQWLIFLRRAYSSATAVCTRTLSRCACEPESDPEPLPDASDVILVITYGTSAGEGRVDGGGQSIVL